MLYVSTRNKLDHYTSNRALRENKAPDGGSFVPYLLPSFDHDKLALICERSFSENVSDTLNLFFSAGLNSWDVEFCIGRYPAKTVGLSNRIYVAELWHNMDSSFSYVCDQLYARLSGSKDKPTLWARIAIKIAFLTGLMDELVRKNTTPIDIALPAGDFSWPMAAWYGRKMGLPIGMIICGCNENSAPWDLIHRGEFNFSSAKINTQLPELDITVPDGLEQLVYATLGAEETMRYLDSGANTGVYFLDEELLAIFAQGLYSAVVGKRRVDSIIGSFYRTDRYLIDGYTALCFGALQDYRSRTGENRNTLLISEHSPDRSATRIKLATGLDDQQFLKILNSPKE